MYAWLTPDTAPTGTKYISLEVPDGEEFEAIIRGALALLFDSWRFEQYGSLTPDQTSGVFRNLAAQWMEWIRGVGVGTVFFSAGSSLPDNALWCDGSQVLQASYPKLYAEIGNSWGSADSGYFRLPDMRDRFPLGSTPVSTGDYELADVGGEEAHTLIGAEMPAHNHDLDYTLDVAQEGVGVPYLALGGVLSYNTSTEGGGGAHNNMPPFATLNAYIIAR